MAFFRQLALRWVLSVMQSRPPDFIVGEASDPYLRRWMLLRRNKWCNIYLHEFCRSDDDVLHDHVYVNASWILRTGYWEGRFRDQQMQELGIEYKLRRTGCWIFRRPSTAHRVELFGTGGVMESAPPNPITLFFCGPRVREWGFHCPKGWKPWHQYIAPTSYGNRRGNGCGE